MEQPKVIFLDAVGTLFGVRGSVGEIYRAIASEVGVEVSAQTLDEAFRESFQAALPPAFPGVDFQEIPQLEFQWWEAIAKNTFERAGVVDQFHDFTDFFAKLYAHFATAEPWYVYADVLSALQNWQELGIELSIISNFDTRIYKVLELLELKEYFNAIAISSTVGSAKPDSKIFLTALAQHQCTPQQAWHIGDSLKEDYHGAKAVGIKAFWLNRSGGAKVVENQLHNLSDLS